MGKRTSSKTAWLAETEIVSIALDLEVTEPVFLPANYNYYLHAWFLNQVRVDDPELSAYLHDGQSEKPFTISHLEGIQLDGEPISKFKQIQLSADSNYRLTIASLYQPLCQWLSKWLQTAPQAINLTVGSLKIVNIAIALPSTTYNQLFAADISTARSFGLSFITPTGFRQKGHHLPLPVPRNLFHSYLRRWNDFAPEAFDQDEFLAWIDKVVYVNELDIASSQATVGKSGVVTGFTGFVEFEIDRKKAIANSDFEQLLYALVKLAPYCGTGHKTTFGLGQTRSGKVEAQAVAKIAAPIATPVVVFAEPLLASPKQQFLSDRTKELSEIFLLSKKRQGGDRASQTAKIWATILARRETGESLQAIAVDLKMPYETVKSYLKLARRVLKKKGEG